MKDMEGLIPHYGHRGRDFYISIESGIQGVFEFGLRVELLVLALPSELWPIGLVRSSPHGDLTATEFKMRRNNGISHIASAICANQQGSLEGLSRVGVSAINFCESRLFARMVTRANLSPIWIQYRSTLGLSDSAGWQATRLSLGVYEVRQCGIQPASLRYRANMLQPSSATAQNKLQ